MKKVALIFIMATALCSTSFAQTPEVEGKVARKVVEVAGKTTVQIAEKVAEKSVEMVAASIMGYVISLHTTFKPTLLTY